MKVLFLVIARWRSLMFVDGMIRNLGVRPDSLGDAELAKLCSTNIYLIAIGKSSWQTLTNNQTTQILATLLMFLNGFFLVNLSIEGHT